MTGKASKACALLSATALLTLAACGSGTNETQGTIDTQADKGLAVLGDNVTYDPNHLVNEGKPITVQYYTWMPDTDGALDAFDAYTEIHPNVTFDIVNVAWADYFTKLPMLLKGKNGPAVFAIHNSYDEVLSPYLATYDIDVDDLKADYVGVEAHVSDGSVRYIDAAINTGNIYYNTTLWAEAGLTEDDIPTTWDEFRQVAIKLTKRDGETLTQCGFNMNGDAGYSSMFEGLNYQKGELLFSSDGTEANFDNDTTKENLEWLHDLYAEDQVCSTDFGTDGDKSFGNGQSAMVYRWGYYEGDLATKYPDIEYGIFPTPTPSDEVPFAYDRYNGESTIGINANASAEQQEVAQDLVRFMLADDTYVKSVSKNMNSFPAKISLNDDEELSQMTIFSLVKPRVDRLIWPGPMPSTIENTAKTVFQNVFNNGMSVDDAVTGGQKTMQSDLKKSNFESVESQYAYIDELK
ncbi:sugar ABC transporter substrate-binding protein [Bifidobacterium lemurum]|uniref:Sugar ABC transporter substrate-binding protein n=1 Tax=Bifidobacterium lemurum TaxID=1603886 RepID=A0A261FWQ4_9BIFI|nr:extracellular solute-binding protein [Bifidobacterium lemurum]OZG63186.1 sugar ABC transporter substrate-binding protein [Bifidobacterium lemurum]QOL33510.1 extracellular solute-binding protein [Bifidobacterium lemurum]